MSNPKPEADRQRRNLPDVIPDVSADPATIPAVPAGLGPSLVRAWQGLWTSPVAQLLDPVSDLPVVTRLFRLYRLGELLDARIAANLGALGNAGPDDEDAPALDDKLLAVRLRVASETRLLEGQIGLSPRSRLALGLALMAGRKGAKGSLDDAADDANG